MEERISSLPARWGVEVKVAAGRRFMLPARSAHPRLLEIGGRWLREGGMVVIRGQDRKEPAERVKQHATGAAGGIPGPEAAFVERDRDGELLLAGPEDPSGLHAG